VAVRASAQTPDDQLRLHALKSSIATCAALNRMCLNLDELVDASWPGVSRARALVGLFEGLVSLPDHVGWMRELSALSTRDTDGKVIEEWLVRYRESVEQYGRWARDRNRVLGQRVFREYFL
jgi:hypothetical protein